MSLVGGVRTRAFSSFLPAEALLWAFVGVAAATAVLVGVGAHGPAASASDYMRTYAVLSPILAAILAGILVAAARREGAGCPLRMATVAPPAFLVAVLLHIAVWGVAASRWLASNQPQLGTTLWMFVGGSLPPALLLCATFVLKLRRLPDRETVMPPSSRTRVLPALSVLFAGLFLITALGAVATAATIEGNWFPRDIAVASYLAAIGTAAILLAALLLAGRFAGRDARGPRAATGPFAAGAAILATSLVALLLMDPLRADFRWNTGVVLFASYGSSLLPSYTVVGGLRVAQRLRRFGATDK